MASANAVNDAGTPRCARVLKAGAASLALAFVLMSALAAGALATPRGIFARFAQCPTGMSGVQLCNYGEVVGGELSIGKLGIPFNGRMVFQGGDVSTGTINKYFMVPGSSGEIISPNELQIPGGLKALMSCPQAGCPGLANTSNGVYITIKSIASHQTPAILNLAAAVLEERTAMVLPVRLQLHNPTLGNACYIGSEAHPIELQLTDGTTSPPPPIQPIRGKGGEASEVEEDGYGLTVLAGARLVDNTFTVPAATGCGGRLSWLVDIEIDHALGLPSPPGRNAATLLANVDLAEVGNVRASEAFPGK